MWRQQDTSTSTSGGGAVRSKERGLKREPGAAMIAYKAGERELGGDTKPFKAFDFD